MNRFWLLELEDDLEAHKTTRTGVWCGVKGVNGVKSLTDLRAITLETLATLLMSDDEFSQGMALIDGKRDSTSYNLIRAYWKRVRQPRLPEPN